jgi:hypothetical protein
MFASEHHDSNSAWRNRKEFDKENSEQRSDQGRRGGSRARHRDLLTKHRAQRESAVTPRAMRGRS